MNHSIKIIHLIHPTTAEVKHLYETEVELSAMTFTSDGELFGGAPDWNKLLSVPQPVLT